MNFMNVDGGLKVPKENAEGEEGSKVARCQAAESLASPAARPPTFRPLPLFSRAMPAMQGWTSHVLRTLLL